MGIIYSLFLFEHKELETPHRKMADTNHFEKSSNIKTVSHIVGDFVFFVWESIFLGEWHFRHVGHVGVQLGKRRDDGRWL